MINVESRDIMKTKHHYLLSEKLFSIGAPTYCEVGPSLLFSFSL
jgi:hypothetical protein